jgi:hypothetical protein
MHVDCILEVHLVVTNPGERLSRLDSIDHVDGVAFARKPFDQGGPQKASATRNENSRESDHDVTSAI